MSFSHHSRFCLKSSLLYYLILLIYLAMVMPSIYGQSQIQIEVKEIQNDYLLYNTYQYKDVQKVDLSDLIISKDVIGKDDPLKEIYPYVPDFKLVLLRTGIAQLKNFGNSPSAYQAAQETAKNEHRGIWANQPTQQPTVQPSIQTATPTSTPKGASVVPSQTPITQTSEDSDQLNKFFTILVAIGVPSVILALLVGYLIRRFYIRRPVRLLIFGELSAGKTAISERLLDPGVERSKLEKLQPSGSIIRSKKKHGIPKGEYVIYPQITDIPGSFYGSVWDEFTKFRYSAAHVWLFVLAATPSKENTGEAQVDMDYVNVQLGIIKAQILGGLEARRTVKPKAVILFINKFDLFSSIKPDDTSSSKTQDDVLRIFAPHIDFITKATSRKKLKFYYTVGSAFNSWKCDYIIDRIGVALYGS